MVVSQQIVVKRYTVGMPAQNSPYAVRGGLGAPLIDVDTPIQALTDDRPLHGDVAHPVGPGSKSLIDASAQRAMIDDHVVHILPLISATQPDGIALRGRGAPRLLITRAHP